MALTFYEQMNRMVENLVPSVEEKERVVPLSTVDLPNRSSILKIIQLLRQLLFPGYFSEFHTDPHIATVQTGNLLAKIYEMLQAQILCAFRSEALQEGLPLTGLEEKTEETICTFFERIPNIRTILATDVQAAFDGDPSARSKDEIIISFPGLFAVTVFRLAHELFALSVPLIPRIMTEHAHSVTGIDIHPGAEVGDYFFIDHGTGVVIGETTQIGRHVKLYQGVTLGALSTRAGQLLRGVKRHPTIEDNVVVYSGASILGGETVIGEGVVIGSNVFITSSVPSGTKVSMKSPELVYKGSSKPQEWVPDWVI